MPSVRRALDDRGLVAIAVVLLVESVLVATSGPGGPSFGAFYPVLVVVGPFCGPAIVAAGLFHGLADDTDPWFVGATLVVGAAATVAGVFAPRVVLGPDIGWPVLGPATAGPYDVLFAVATAIEFLGPAIVLSAGAVLCARVDTTRQRVAVLAVTALVAVAATAAAYDFVPTLVEWWRGAPR